MSKCNDQSIITHETQWEPQQCVDGGIFRAKRTYTNIETSGFNTNIGYSGNYYGIRKYDNLIPLAPYNITIHGRSGDDKQLELPREINEWEYGSNENVDYSGVKIISPTWGSGDKYGKSVGISKDFLAIGAPFATIHDSENYPLKKAGTVFVYKRDDQPSGDTWSYDKAEWLLDSKVNLPTEIIRDYKEEEQLSSFVYDNTVFNLPNGLTITQNKWFVGQEGREFGHSLDICSTTNLQNSLGENKKNILVISGPSCSFSRKFEEIVPSSINVCFFIFTDNFYYDTSSYFSSQLELNINQTILETNTLFRFFSNPSTEINAVVNIVESLVPQDTRPEILIPEPKPKNINKERITRHYNVLQQDEEFFNRDDLIFEKLKNYFLLSFPYDESKKNNNIPAIVGFYIDSSFKFGGERALQPALNRFINFYQQYSFASGLKNIYDIPSSGFTFKFPSTLSDDWVEQSKILIKKTLSLENLQNENVYTLFASELGQFNDSDPVFNTPPSSGGAVFIFEKESGDWNLIQTINSPTLLNDVHPDRFGHCVKISDNGEVIVIGSPYINDAILAYEYDINVDKNLFSNLNFEYWLLEQKNNQNNFYYNNLWDTFLNLKQSVGQKEASESIYLQLSQIDKYNYRKNYPIYKETFRYSYSNIQYGTWSFFVDKVAPTQRMGYSVAINEDASKIVAGCPTDSLNEFDDSTIYYAPSRPQYSTWHSYVNAGAVRVFESRKYFPHNTVVDYRKFGNLEYEISESGDHKYFSHLKQIYNEADLNFIETDFADVDIPEEAGLVFITTPQIDAASDEIIDNIKNWLSLGDRNLVLVGNDPIWEKNGLYFESNEIINKILRKLNSRMVIVPARNEYESLASGYLTHYNFNDNEDINFQSNVLYANKTGNSFSFMNVYGNNLYASGVGDIKFYYPNAYLDYSICDKQYLLLNNRMCKMPIKHLGDLRSEWTDSCDGPVSTIYYSVDIPLFIGDVSLGNFGCVGSLIPEPVNRTIKHSPVPLLVAAEPSPPIETIYPAIPTTSSIVPRDIITGSRTTTTKRYNVDNVTNTNIDFIWSLDSGNYINIDLNTTNETHSSAFINSSINLTNGLLQSIANTTSEELKNTRFLDDFASIVAEENYLNTNSKIILIATTSLESNIFIDNLSVNSFFFNLVSKNEDGDSFIAQLGDWTGHDSFQSAEPTSILNQIFSSFFNTVDTNVSSEQLFSGRIINNSYNEYDVAWIARPQNLPNDEELSYIKEWLSRGDKKLIITYQVELSNNQVDSLPRAYFNNSPAQYISNFNEISRVTTLCKMLNIFMEPWYGNGNNNYALGYITKIIQLNKNNFISQGFTEKKSNIEYISSNILNSFFVPINVNNTATRMAWGGIRPSDKEIVNTQFWEFKTGIAKVTFPTLPGSGYRIFINTEKNIEDLSLDIQLNRCIRTSDFPLNPIENKEQFDSFIRQTPEQPLRLYSEFIDGNIRYIDAQQESFKFNVQKEPSNAIPHYLRKNFDFFDFVATDTSIDVMFNISQDVAIPTSGLSSLLYRRLEQVIRPKTEKLISISGTMLDIEENKYTVPIITREFDWVTRPGSPERIVLGGPKTRPISTSSKKYCPSQRCIDVVEDKIIADGPVIVAQEMDTFSNFENGVKPSIITVISDSSIVQGKMITDDNDNIREDIILFLQSLYPNTVFPSDTRGRSFSDVISKIQAPERMTPQRLYSHIANVGHNINFQPVNYIPSIDGSPSVFTTNPQVLTASSGKSLSDYIEYFSGYLENEFIKTLEPIRGKSPEYVDIEEGKSEVTPAEWSGIFNNFNNVAASFGGYSKFSSYINGKYYQDARPGDLPEIMKDTGFDYLDFEYFSSGYPGELFGYSVDIYKNKILIGAPFSCFESENITNWEDIVNNTNALSKPSGVFVGYNGGAGAVYLYEILQESTGVFGQPTRWGCSRKFRPYNINIGQDTNNLNEFSSDNVFGNHNYTSDDLLYSITGDQFGRSVQIYSDIIAIGAPGHDFETYIEQTFNSGEFILKSFNESFDIPQRKIYDLGSSGVRSELSNSGIAVLNNGAIFTYENKLYNWQDKTQIWEQIQKLVPQGYNSRLQKTYIGSNNIPVSGSENDNFGSYIVLDRTKRSDSDYTLFAGTPLHKFGLSGNPILDVGCVYTYDGILRKPIPAIIDKDSFIDIRVFGETLENKPQVKLRFDNSIANHSYYASGIVFSNNEGEIFIEASGQDFTDKIYTLHRPYVKSIYGSYFFGEPNNSSLNLKIDGQFNQNSGNMNLFSNAVNSAIVYNTLGLYQSAVLGIASGVPSGLFLYTDCPSGITISESGFALYASGTGFTPENLNLRVRGK